MSYKEKEQSHVQGVVLQELPKARAVQVSLV